MLIYYRIVNAYRTVSAFLDEGLRHLSPVEKRKRARYELF
jgi:hypothetical protein